LLLKELKNLLKQQEEEAKMEKLSENALADVVTTIFNEWWE